MASLRDVMRRRGVPGSARLDGAAPPPPPDPLARAMEQQRALQAQQLEGMQTAQLIAQAQAAIAKANADSVRAEVLARKAAEPPLPPPPAAPDGSLVSALLQSMTATHQQLSEAQNKQLDNLRQELGQARQILMQDSKSQTPQAPPKSVVQELTELKQIFETVQTVLPTSKPVQDARADLEMTIKMHEINEAAAERAALREHQMEMERTRLEMERRDLDQRHKLAWEEWEAKKGQRSQWADWVKETTPTIGAFIQQMLRAAQQPGGLGGLLGGGGGQAGPLVPQLPPDAAIPDGQMRLQCPACRAMLDITPGTGPTQWRCPNCQSVLLHPQAGANQLVLQQAGPGAAPEAPANGHVQSELLQPPGPPPTGYTVREPGA